MRRAVLFALFHAAACETNILLFGDSLTAGLSGKCEHSYAIELARLSGCPVSYAGFPAATSGALLELFPRIRDHIESQKANGSPFTIAAVLAGTNDMHLVVEGVLSPAELAFQIETIHRRLANVTGIQTFALAIPTPGQDSYQTTQRILRHEVNDRLSVLCERSQGRHVFVNSDALLPRLFQGKAVEDHRFAEVHYTPHGYNELAGVVGDALLAAGVPFCPLWGAADMPAPLRVKNLNTPTFPRCYENTQS
jgi:hypothetical protein